MKFMIKPISTIIAYAFLAGAAFAAVSADEAAALKSTLTPMGAEKAGNKDGSIPAWTGGYTTPTPGYKKGGRRPDPFASDKPLYSITAKNMAQYADKLTDGTKAMLQKYPDTFRVDVYPSKRTYVAPQWFYDKTFENATKVKLSGLDNPYAVGALGGIPFPIPKNGAEVMVNHQLSYKLEQVYERAKNFTVNSSGQAVMVSHYENYFTFPYNTKGVNVEDGQWWYKVRSTNIGPPIRAGEAVMQHFNVNEDKTLGWIYLTGQRRVRKLPNVCCDTQLSFSAGILTFDELTVFEGDMSRFDWNLVGKKEILVPYNSNRTMVPSKTADVITGAHLNPDHVRWELHRVWVVDATLKPGKRHVSPKSRYYIDEDSWYALLGDRWDAQGKLARTMYLLPIVAPDVPAFIRSSFGLYDLIGGNSYLGSLYNDESVQIRVEEKPFPASTYSPDSMAGEGIR